MQLATLASAVARAPLADAVEHRDADAVSELLKKTDVNAPQADGMLADLRRGKLATTHDALMGWLIVVGTMPNVQ